MNDSIPFVPGNIYAGIPAERYHALPHVSASLLRKYHTIVEVGGQTPRHVQIALREPFVPTWQSIVGTLVHQSILEPENPLPQIAIQPEEYEPGKKWTNSAKVCKAWKAEQEASGKIVLKQSEVEVLQGITAEIGEKYGAIFADCETEQTLIYDHAHHGIILKARIDCNAPGPALYDIKTCRDASDREFEKQAYESGYHMQAALYLDLWNALDGATNPKTEFVFVAVENSAPFGSRLRKCSDAFIERGRSDNGRWMRLHKQYVNDNHWPGYEDKTLDVPAWVARKDGVE